MESVFWFGFGILTGMAALPWLQRLALGYLVQMDRWLRAYDVAVLATV